MIGIFRQAARDLREVWELVLTPDTLAGVSAAAADEDVSLRFPPGLWVQVIYDFAVAYHRTRLASSQLLRSLVPSGTGGHVPAPVRPVPWARHHGLVPRNAAACAGICATVDGSSFAATGISRRQQTS
jgi:hypothetical protein